MIESECRSPRCPRPGRVSVPSRRIVVGLVIRKLSWPESCRFAAAGKPLVRRLDAVPEREVAGEAPGCEPEEKDGEDDPGPLERDAGTRAWRARVAGSSPTRRSRRLARRKRELRQLRAPASTAVDAVRLLFRGHAARYGSQPPWRETRAIGIDVGGTKILAGVVERDGTIVRVERRETPTDSAEEFLRGLAEVVDALRDETIGAVGIGIPSTIDQRDGSSVFSVHVPIAGVPLRERGQEYLGLPVAVDNDANAAAVAEWTIGAGKGTSEMIMLTLGTGIGGGLILGGRLYRGWTGAAAELGHMVLEFDGPRCRGFCTGPRPLRAIGLRERCRGHREGAAGTGCGSARAPRRRRAAAISGRSRRCTRWEGVSAPGMASLVNIFNPELIVIGGGFGVALDLMLEPALETLKRDALPPGRDLVRVVPATLGEEAGMVGAALIAFEALDAAG